jgi:hypothetical protein
MTPLAVVAVVVAVVVVIFFVLLRSRRGPPEESSLPYEGRKYLLSAAERSLFGVLEQATQGEYHLFVKVRVADLLYVKKGATGRQGHLNRVTSKHIDFLLCDRAALSPVLAIELDDRSHDAESRQQRDAFLDAAFAAAGLPLLHVKASRSYDATELARQIASRIDASKAGKGATAS